MILREKLMIQHQIVIQIARPLSDVFTFLTDARNHPKWDALSVEMEPQEAGAWHQGLKFREVRKVGGRNTEVSSQIAVFEPNKRMEIQSLSGPDFHGTWIFAPAEGGTHLTYKAEMKMGGLMRLLEPMIAGQFKQQIDANFANLKHVLESGS
jgi:uncharacterized membrane protein